MKYQYKVKGVDYDVEIQDIDGNIANVTVNGIPFEVEMNQPIKPTGLKKSAVSTATPKAAPAPSAKSEPVAEAAPTASNDAGSIKIQAPLPGTINEVKVSVGDHVNAGDTVVVLEAMKMQNNIEADKEGTVKQIKVAKGDNVMEGDVLVTLG